MNLNERVYFERRTNYKSKSKSVYADNQQDIDYFSAQIRNTAKDALRGDISTNNAKKEIYDLLDNIKQLKKEGKINVTLG